MARRNRAEIVVPDEVGVYHCIQRVVRRAFLCGVDPLSGNSYDHRRGWIRDRLESLAGLFGVEVAAFAVMSNHVHVILRNRPDVVALWTDQEVAVRWLTLFPGRVGTQPDPVSALAPLPGPTAEQASSPSPGTPAMPPAGEPTDPLEQAVAMLSADPALMATIRGRLSSLSWFMRALAEPIARRANREDQCTGRFWEGRFKSQRLLDEAALLACSVYVDLNPIRAGLADRPETSELTSAHERIMALFQDIRTKPDTAAVDAVPMAAAPADPSATALVEEDSPVLAEESPEALTGSGNVEPARQDTAEVPLRRDGWLSPIELDERAEPLTTAMATPQTAAAATKRVGSQSCAASQRPRAVADDAGELPGAAGLDGSSIASRDEWCDPAGVGVNPRSASGLGRVVAGDGRPVRPPVPPRGGPGRPSENRGPASERELVARPALEPGGIRVTALSLTPPVLCPACGNSPGRGLTGVTSLF